MAPRGQGATGSYRHLAADGRTSDLHYVETAILQATQLPYSSRILEKQMNRATRWLAYPRVINIEDLRPLPIIVARIYSRMINARGYRPKNICRPANVRYDVAGAAGIVGRRPSRHGCAIGVELPRRQKLRLPNPRTRCGKTSLVSIEG